MTDKVYTQTGGPRLSGYSPERTEFPQDNPLMSDKFTREQILEYLMEIPLGYSTERDHEVTEKLIHRVCRHFLHLSTDWRPNYDD